MTDSKLVRMANDIANFFQAYPADQAATGIHDHVTAFWTPKMRVTLRDLAHTETSGLHPLVVAAMLEPTPAHSPVEKEAAGPAAVGEIGASDAG